MRFILLAFAPLFLAFLSSSAFAQEPIVELYHGSMRSGDDFNLVFPAHRGWREIPLEIRSGEAAREHFTEEFYESALAEIDWEASFVLVFCWSGSGRDRLTYEVNTDTMPAEVTFHYTPGFTRDFGAYLQVYQMQSDVVWEYQTGQRQP